MPLYDYRCDACNVTTETTHKMNESPSVLCPTCGGEMRKKIGVPYIVWGTGFTKPMDWGWRDHEVYYPDGHHKTKTHNERMSDGAGI